MGKHLSAALFGGAFFLITSITIGLTRENGGLALVWLGTGIGASWLLATPREHWKRTLVLLVLLSTLATTLFGFGPRPAVPLAFANALEAWLVARLLLMFRGERDWLDTVGGLIIFIAIGGIVAPAIASLAGATTVTVLVGGIWSHHATNWLIGHGLGTVIGFPIVRIVAGWAADRSALRPTLMQAAEFALHALIVLAVSLATFEQSRLPLMFVTITPVLFAAFRCGRAGAALGTIIVGAVAGWSFQAGDSFVNTLALTESRKVLFLQFYLATVTLLAMPISVTLRQHQLFVQELQYTKALRRVIGEHSDDALINLDEAGHIRFASLAGETMTGRSDLEGKHFSIFFDPLDEAEITEALDRAAADPGTTMVIERSVLRGGDELWLEARLRTANGVADGIELKGFAVTIRDVTARKLGELDALHAAETDPLTQLPNRRVLLRQIERAIDAAEDTPAALAIVDLDRFKLVNDTHGHGVGDAVLRQVANVMRQYAGPRRMFARLGGEEFALLDTGSSLAASQALCDDLRGAIAAIMPRGADGSRFILTASIGVAPLVPGQTVPSALQAADELLYGAKSKGRNRVEAPPPLCSDRNRKVA